MRAARSDSKTLETKGRKITRPNAAKPSERLTEPHRGLNRKVPAAKRAIEARRRGMHMSFGEFKYNFPECTEYVDQFHQAYKVREEARELVTATMDKKDTAEHQVEECLDAVWAAETYLRHADQETVKRMKLRVVQKNRARGYCK